LAPCLERVCRGEVRRGEVDDVDLVAYAGAVGGRIVVAEDKRLFAGADRTKDFGKEVVGRMISQFRRPRADDVEVSERCLLQSRVDHGEVAQQPFADDL